MEQFNGLDQTAGLQQNHCLDQMHARTSNYEDGAHLDVSAQGFWGDRHDRAFFDVRVFNPLAPSNCRSSLTATYRRHENIKKRRYEQRIIAV